MRARNYDIFSGSVDNDPIWVETVEGIVAATNRMEVLARTSPGCYFVYSVEDSTVLASIATRKTKNVA